MGFRSGGKHIHPYENNHISCLPLYILAPLTSCIRSCYNGAPRIGNGLCQERLPQHISGSIAIAATKEPLHLCAFAHAVPGLVTAHFGSALAAKNQLSNMWVSAVISGHQHRNRGPSRRPVAHPIHALLAAIATDPDVCCGSLSINFGDITNRIP